MKKNLMLAIGAVVLVVVIVIIILIVRKNRRKAAEKAAADKKEKIKSADKLTTIVILGVILYILGKITKGKKGEEMKYPVDGEGAEGGGGTTIFRSFLSPFINMLGYSDFLGDESDDESGGENWTCQDLDDENVYVTEGTCKDNCTSTCVIQTTTPK